MAQLPVSLPLGFKVSEDYPKARERLVNCFSIGGNKIVSRAGIQPQNTGVGKCRGADFHRRRLFHASGSDLLIIPQTIDATPVNLGILGGADLVFFSPGHTMMIILPRGGTLAKWEDTGGNGTLTQDTDQPRAYIDVAFMDGRWFYCPADGGPIDYSEVGDGFDIRPLSFFDAELLPDNNLGLITVRNTLYVLGEESIELFRTRVTLDENGVVISVVQRVEGGQLQWGYIGGRIEFNVSFAFVGRNIDGHAGIFVAGSGSALKISNDAVDDVLTEYTIAELSLVKSQRYTWHGVDLIVFTFLRETLTFGGGEWHIDTSDNNPAADAPWRGVFCQFAYGDYYVGDLETSLIGTLRDIDQDYDLDIDREIYTFIREAPNTQFTVKSLELDARMGLVETPGIVPDTERTEFHTATQWQIATEEAFTNIVFDSGTDITNLTVNTINFELEADTDYWWRSRYQGEVSGFGSYSVPTIFTTLAFGISPPVNLSPGNGATAQPIGTDLVANAFKPVGGAQVHDNSQWQVATDLEFTSIVFDSGDDPVNLTTITVNPNLDNNTQYFWRVRYQGDVSGYSAYSAPTAYTTVEVDGVRQPTNLTPIDSAVDQVIDALILTANAFNVIGPAQTHINSQWQVATDQFFGNIVIDSGDDPVNLVDIAIAGLEKNTQYWWHVRYEGNTTGYSPYSASTTFTTVAQYVLNYVDASAPAWLHRAASFFGGSGLSFSFWFQSKDLLSGAHYMFDFVQTGANPTRGSLSVNSGGGLHFEIVDANGVLRKRWDGNIARGLFNGVNQHLLVSANTDADSIVVYLNDTVWGDDFNSVDIAGSWFSSVWNQNSIFTSFDEVNARTLGYEANSDFWLDSESIDWDIESNRRKFIDENGFPVDLGPNGENPTGFPPRVFIGDSMVAADWNTGISLGSRQEWDDGTGAWNEFTDGIQPSPPVTLLAVDPSTNIQPASGATDIGLTPTLIASAFVSDTIVTIPGGATEPNWRVGLSVSQDGVTFGPEIYRPLGKFGKYNQRMAWRGPGGLGRYESFMGIRLRTNAPIEFSVDGLWVDI